MDNANPQKQRKGLVRIWYATTYSAAGLKAGWNEPAFKQECMAAIVMLPMAFFIAQSWVETVLLAGSVVLVLIVELLNTAIESTIDRIGAEWHELSKRSKDMGSAAVFLSLLLCGCIWISAIYQRFT
jgi:diacylglycerol kinase (ATP)